MCRFGTGKIRKNDSHWNFCSILLIFRRVTKEEARQDEILTNPETFSARNDTLYSTVATATEAPDSSFLDSILSTIGLRSLRRSMDDEDRMIGK